MAKKTDEKEKAAQTMRTIDFNEDLISGDLQSLTQLVNDLKELELCYRGNHRIITLYYKGHVVFNVFKYKEKYRGKGKYKVTFDFGHARYTENWRDYYAKLKVLGFSHSSDMQDKKRNNIKYIIDDGDDPDWAELVKTITPLIDDFFRPDKNKDFFEDKIKTSKGALLEKIRQQEIMTALKETDTGYFIYDMEFTQTLPSRDVNKLGKPDMLALKFELRKPTKVVLVEVKSTSEACYYKETGVNAHYKAMKQYIICKKPEYMKIRKEEAIKIFNDYAAAGMRGLNEKNILMVNPDSLGEEILFIFTDDAREEIKNNNVPEHLKMKFEDEVLKSH